MTHSHCCWSGVPKGCFIKVAAGFPQNESSKRPRRGILSWPGFRNLVLSFPFYSIFEKWVTESNPNEGKWFKGFEHILNFLTDKWWFLKHITPFQLKGLLPLPGGPGWEWFMVPLRTGQWEVSLFKRKAWNEDGATLQPTSGGTHFQRAAERCNCLPMYFSGSHAAKVCGPSLEMDPWVCCFLVWIAELRGTIWVSIWPGFISRLTAELSE